MATSFRISSSLSFSILLPPRQRASVELSRRSATVEQGTRCGDGAQAHPQPSLPRRPPASTSSKVHLSNHLQELQNSIFSMNRARRWNSSCLGMRNSSSTRQRRMQSLSSTSSLTKRWRRCIGMTPPRAYGSGEVGHFRVRQQARDSQRHRPRGSTPPPPPPPSRLHADAAAAALAALRCHCSRRFRSSAPPPPSRLQADATQPPP
uniref:Uncharacterized protein n=1 Tax=Oryza barthii TaxID=65489 RepID=A0A0D3G5L7_9ORYZ